MRSALLLMATLCLLVSCNAHGPGKGEPERTYVTNYGLDDEPQYGGTLRVATRYYTLSALSWDAADWAWKDNHDKGAFAEQLFAADLEQSVRKGGPYRFIADAWLPDDAIRGELAESWEWEDPLTLAVKLRRGVMFPEKPGLMEAREFDAEDVVYSYDIRAQSPKKIATYFEHIDRVYARDKHTVVFEFNQYNAEWAYRFGYGYYSNIVPKETGNVDPKLWQTANGTGPLQLTKYIESHTQVYEKNELYWDTEPLQGKQHKIPFIDRLEYRIIKDEATALTALRTGKLDIHEIVRWLVVDHLKESTPELQWSKWLVFVGTFVSLRMDMEPFDDLRVRRALNMAIDKQEVVDLYYGGNAELFAYPMHPEYKGYYEPLEAMPASVQELFQYDPEKAKALLAEAGYPDGFEFEIQVCSCNPNHMDLLPLLVDHLARVGVTATIKPFEYAAHLSLMSSSNHGPGYMVDSGHVSPITTLRKTFMTDQLWNISKYSDPDFDRRLAELIQERDEGRRRELAKELTIEGINNAPYIWLPTSYAHTAWWPWVKNYNGELRAGAVRPGPIYARVWIDQELKKELGFGDER